MSCPSVSLSNIDEAQVPDRAEGGPQLPLSPVFIDFLARWLDNSGFAGEPWFDQRTETLSNSITVMRCAAGYRLERLLTEAAAQAAIEAVYRRFYGLLMNCSSALDGARERYRFISVVGAPRTGGSYLTGELFCALGYDPTGVPAAVAHDGFPEARPISDGDNAWVNTLLTTSQYLTMLDLYFSDRDCGRPIIVPKKLTKSVYAGSFFNALLGEKAEYLITIRHPIASCVSTYEKSGGLPADGLFTARSAMEKWIRRDLLHMGVSASELADMEYFAAYVRYWEQYYINLAMSGLTANRLRSVVAFGERNMEEAAQLQHCRLGSGRSLTKFVSPEPAYERHPQWSRRSKEAMERVAAVWHLVGLPFPAAELQRCN
jgi:hypothetical protein